MPADMFHVKHEAVRAALYALGLDCPDETDLQLRVPTDGNDLYLVDTPVIRSERFMITKRLRSSIASQALPLPAPLALRSGWITAGDSPQMIAVAIVTEISLDILRSAKGISRFGLARDSFAIER